MRQTLKRLSRSRKAIAALAGIMVTLVMLATGQIDANTATLSITGMLSVLMGAIAYEDGQQKRGS